MNRANDSIDLLAEKRSPSWRQITWSVLFLLSVLGLGVLDHVTGRELTFFQFYLIPVSLAGWYIGRWPGIIIAIASTFTWSIVDNWGGNPYSLPVIAYWNAFSRMTIFLLAVYVIDHNRQQLVIQTRLAEIDPHTGAYNTRRFIALLQQEIERAKQKKCALTLVFIDLDNFKQVNDSRGHTAGDEALASVVHTIKMYIRSADWVGRMGGDEFALLLANTPPAGAQRAIDRLHSTLTDEMQAKGWPITFSIGVITCHQSFCSPEEMIKISDNLMYSVKLSTKNGVVYQSM